jgi:hypothetical protein
MPARISNLINTETSQNKVTGVIPILASLLQQDRHVESAYLCDAETIQVYKLSGEGNHFCGYRNIQMLLLHEQTSIPEMQELIEKAWDQKFNSHGLVETGGIKGTRKHIGTSEAQALLLSRGVACTARVFTGKYAWHEQLGAIEDYFTSSVQNTAIHGVHQTKLPPIFLQRPRHSITIVGVERLRNGKRRLLTFDPGYRPPAIVRKPSDTSHSLVSAWLILWRYRRGEAYLKRYQSFEMLLLDQVPPVRLGHAE